MQRDFHKGEILPLKEPEFIRRTWALTESFSLFLYIAEAVNTHIPDTP
jgi:hypothetical protein